MILLVAVLVGGLTGWGIAKWQGKTWHSPIFRFPFLVVIGFLPQFCAFYFPLTRHQFSDSQASLCLILSQIMLLIFGWLNRSLPGMIILMLGLGCNLAVILANNGFMPLPLETAKFFVSQEAMGNLILGGRISSASKDILLPEASIYLPWLADRFVFPDLFSYQFAYSIGDVFIAFGAFWLLVKGQMARPDLETGDLL